MYYISYYKWKQLNLNLHLKNVNKNRLIKQKYPIPQLSFKNTILNDVDNKYLVPKDITGQFLLVVRKRVKLGSAKFYL